jgi:CspA family cold shock protein
MTGEIVTLKTNYGYLKDCEDRNRFFHASFLRGIAFDDLRIGDRVEFTGFTGPRGYRAEDIKLLDPTEGRVAAAFRKIAGVGR